MQSANDTMRVVDVYEAAAQIGKDFEFLIERYGVDSVGSLMPKVIRVLEELEQCATDRESASLVTNKQSTVSRFEDEGRVEQERKLRLGERAQFEKELEQLDEAWRLETGQLNETIARLEEENRHLHNDLNTRNSNSVELQRSPNPANVNLLTASTTQGNENLSYSVYSNLSAASANQAELISKLKSLITAQRAELKALRKTLLEREGELDAFEIEMRRTLTTVAEFRGILCDRERRAVALREERADISVQLDAKEHMLQTVDELIAKQSASQSGRNPSSKSDGLPDANGAVHRNTALPTDVRDMTVSFALGTSKRPSESEQLTSPGGSDLNFSLAELSTLIRERTRLRIQLAGVDTELAHFMACKPLGYSQATPNSLNAVDGRLATSSPMRTGSRIDESSVSTSDDWDRAVQGPINKEPDEKVFPERFGSLRRQTSDRESKIKRLFQTVIDKFNELNVDAD